MKTSALIALLPLFTLCQSPPLLAEDTSPEDLQWQQRVLVFNIDKKQQLPSIEKDIRDEFKLTVFAIFEGKTYRLDDDTTLTPLPDSQYRALSERYAQKQQVWLIGLDGGIKANYSIENFDMEKVAAFINTMPMRQWELNQ
ncbi:DUF4174 domain-containing protein [Thalassotalea sp. Y01]|uniref:DUF4174 domain-containing protein n=1 Tax=Thalassotalea sp. Y01 TaxID=2729613 RepID=UPI00145DF1D1|nr:DUF4174 domain-containing protein [Thalassotalea sp. Y01]NMP14998.1 DUF4174 domain-containing protein [Thalassotalea sp. Y01]